MRTGDFRFIFTYIIKYDIIFIVNLEYSNIDWEKRISEVKLDLQDIWHSNRGLMDRGVGDTRFDKLVDEILYVPQRENESEPLRIVPIKKIENLSFSEKNRLSASKEHMFASHVWNLIRDFYREQNECFKGLSKDRIVTAVRQEIRACLQNDDQSSKVYEDALRTASVNAFVALDDALAEAILSTLDYANREAAVNEALKAFNDGQLKGEYIKDDEPTEENILHAYVTKIIDTYMHV